MVANLVAIPLVTLRDHAAGAARHVCCRCSGCRRRLAVQGLAALLAACTDWPLGGLDRRLPHRPGPSSPGCSAPRSLRCRCRGASACWRCRLRCRCSCRRASCRRSGRFELVAVDVGQGTAVLVRTRSRLLLFDTGPRYGPRQRCRRARLAAAAARARRAPHRPPDPEPSRQRPCRRRAHAARRDAGDRLARLARGRPSAAPARRRRTGAAPPASAGTGTASISRSCIRCPDADLRQPRANGLSCVLRIAASAPGGGSALLTGDIERPEELALVARAGAALRSSVLLVPHHGSRSSSSAGAAGRGAAAGRRCPGRLPQPLRSSGAGGGRTLPHARCLARRKRALRRLDIGAAMPPCARRCASARSRAATGMPRRRSLPPGAEARSSGTRQPAWRRHFVLRQRDRVQ